MPRYLMSQHNQGQLDPCHWILPAEHRLACGLLGCEGRDVSVHAFAQFQLP